MKRITVPRTSLEPNLGTERRYVIRSGGIEDVWIQGMASFSWIQREYFEKQATPEKSKLRNVFGKSRNNNNDS